MSVPDGGSGGSRRAAARARLFPGSTAVWLAGLLIVLVGAVFVGRILMARTASTTGTNSVDVAAVVAHATAGERTCIRDLVVPRQTGRIDVWLAPVQVRSPRARLQGWVEQAGIAPVPLRYVGSGGLGDFKPFALTRRLPRDLDGAQVCIVAHGEGVNYGGSAVARLPNAAVSSVGRRPIAGADVSVHLIRFRGDSPRVVDALGAALARATVFDPGAARVAIYLVALLLLLAIYPIVRIAATAQRYSIRRLAAAAALLAFVHACAWVFLLQPFHGADESEHFAYAQHLAATGHVPDSRQSSTRSPYASSQLRLMAAVHHGSTVLNTTSRLRWDAFYAREYRASLLSRPSDADGGGYTESATGHSPLYYAFVGLPYQLLGRPTQLPSALLLMRLLSALLAAAVAALAVLTAGHLLPRRREAAWLAGVLVATQPVFASVSAAVNNDTAVNVLAAAMAYLLVRSWRRGFSVRDAVLVGVVAILLPVAKITGFALLPLTAVAALALALQHGWPAAVRWAAIAGSAALATLLLWIFVASPLLGGGRGALVNVHPLAGQAAVTPGAVVAHPATVAKTVATASPTPLPMTLLGRAEYFEQTFVPPIQLGPKRWQIPGSNPSGLTRWPAFVIYIDRGYGLFGWKSTSLTFDILRTILFVLAAGWALALVAAVRERARWRSWLGGVVILGGALVSVLALVSYAYAKPDLLTEPGEQGRYVFTAIVPLAVLLSAAVLAFRGHLGRIILGAGVSAAWLVAIIAWTSALRGWYM